MLAEAASKTDAKTYATIAPNYAYGKDAVAAFKKALLALRPDVTFSGGEQQMLSIARTLMGNPCVLLLDEPSEGIAPVIVEQMARTILTLKNEGLSVLLSEQNLHFAKLVSDRAVIIESGEKKYDGTFAELEASPEVRDAYLSV